jgi:haloalkane dehalogenase
VRWLDDAARAAYDAPFPDEASKVGPRVMPTLVPTRPDDPATEANRAAWEVLQHWDRPFLVAFSDGDPITGPMAPVLRKLVPGTHGLDHPVIALPAGGRRGGARTRGRRLRRPLTGAGRPETGVRPRAGC